MSAPMLIRDARALTMVSGIAAGPTGARHGGAMNDLGVIDRADVLIEGDRIAAVGPSGSVAPPRGVREIDARGRVLMPGFIDAHTHACWAGSRVDEWQRRLKGESYLDILKAGGGIMSTVRAVRAASQAELEANLRERLALALREGTTTIEVKSGYGLTTQDELKMLRAIRACATRANEPSVRAKPAAWPWHTKGGPTVVATALLGHAIDAASGPGSAPATSREEFVRRTIEETLPAVSAEFPGIAIDAFCEDGAWTRDECIALFDRAMSLGHPVRMHADQFNALGMVDWAIERAAQSRGLQPARASDTSLDASPRILSIDHLEATPPKSLGALGASRIFGVALPCAGFHTDGRYMNARAFIEANGIGGALVIATNCNPGSAPTSSMPFAIALAVRHLKLTPAEAICASTVNAAALLGFTDRGFIAPGARADVILLRHTDERALAYEFGGNPVDVVVCAGEAVESAPV